MILSKWPNMHDFLAVYQKLHASMIYHEWTRRQNISHRHDHCPTCRELAWLYIIKPLAQHARSLSFCGQLCKENVHIFFVVKLSWIKPLWTRIFLPWFHPSASENQYTFECWRRKLLQMDLKAIYHFGSQLWSIQSNPELWNLWSEDFLFRKNIGTWSNQEHQNNSRNRAPIS